MKKETALIQRGFHNVGLCIFLTLSNLRRSDPASKPPARKKGRLFKAVGTGGASPAFDDNHVQVYVSDGASDPRHLENRPFKGQFGTELIQLQLAQDAGRTFGVDLPNRDSVSCRPW